MEFLYSLAGLLVLTIDCLLAVDRGGSMWKKECHNFFVLLLCVWLVNFNLAAQRQEARNYQRARNLNNEGYRAYSQKNWNLALQKFAKAMKLDPRYIYPIYNTACVLSLRGRPQDAYRIYRLLLKVMLQESNKKFSTSKFSIHRVKMQKDPDLAWFRRHEPELFILLNNVILDYDSRPIYEQLRERRHWNIGTGMYMTPQAPSIEDYRKELDEEIDFLRGQKLDFGYRVPSEERQNSLTVTPDDQGQSGQVPRDQASGLDKNWERVPDGVPKTTWTPELETAPPPFSKDFDPFSDGEKNLDPFGEMDYGPQGFPGFDKEESNGFSPFVPQSLRPQYKESQLTFNLISRHEPAKPAAGTERIIFDGYRYAWRFQIDDRLFEMQGFFVVRGNVLILETFASSPAEIAGLPFDWEIFRSLFFIYQPQPNEFHAATSVGKQLKIY